MPGLQFGIVLGTRRLAALISRDAARYFANVTVFDVDHAHACGFLTAIAGQDDWTMKCPMPRQMRRCWQTNLAMR